MPNTYIPLLKQLTTVTVLFHDTGTAPTNSNINDKAQILIYTILDNIEISITAKEYLTPVLHEISSLITLLCKSEQERFDILDQCAFLKVDGRKL